MDKTVLFSIPVQDLQLMIVDCVNSCLKHKPNDNVENLEQSDNLLTRDETCKFLKVDSSTLWAWTNKGKVKAYGLGSRRYYKRSELIEALIPLKK